MRKHTAYHSLFALLFVIIFTSCDGEKIESAKESIKAFQDAYKQENFDRITQLYPNLRELSGQFRKIDTIEFGESDECIVKNDTVILNGRTKWTNPFGKVFSNEVTFYLVPKEIDKKDTYIIIDTRGFVSFDEFSLYRYALKKEKGLSSMLDVAKSKAISKYSYDFEIKKQQVKSLLENNLKISGFNWELGYFGDSASGRAVVTNNTGVTLSKVKYKITYFKSDDKTVVTTDDGYVTYSDINPGESKSFTWYTSYVNGARRARVDCFIDDETIIEEGAIALAQ